MKKIINPIIVLAVLAAVAGGLWKAGLIPVGQSAAQAQAANAAPPPVPVSVAKVLERSVTEWD